MITSGWSPFRREGENRPVEGDVGRIMRRVFFAALALVAGLLALGEGQAIAGMVVLVNAPDPNSSDAMGCGNGPNPPCRTLQFAIDHANPGDTVLVKGTYAEQVTIGVGKNGLTLHGLTLGATIQAPPTPLTGPKAIVHIKGATGVTITGFTIKGPGPGACGSLAAGIYVSDWGFATITNNHITSIRDNPVSGCQNGHGIRVGGWGVSAQAGGISTAYATVQNNSIDDYQKHGIVVEGAASTADIGGNKVIGLGPTKVIAQHGIRIADGARGTVTGNYVSGNFYNVELTMPGMPGMPGPPASSGLKALRPWSGVVGVIIQGNLSFGNQIGIHLEDSFTANVGSNNVLDGNDLGILLTRSSFNYVGYNTISGGRAGVVVADSSNNNNLDRNEIRYSRDRDAVDQTMGSGTAGTANTWSNNTCAVSMTMGFRVSDPSGLC